MQMVRLGTLKKFIRYFSFGGHTLQQQQVWLQNDSERDITYPPTFERRSSKTPRYAYPLEHLISCAWQSTTTSWDERQLILMRNSIMPANSITTITNYLCTTWSICMYSIWNVLSERLVSDLILHISHYVLMLLLAYHI